MQSRTYFSRMRVASASLLVAFLVACGGGPSADISRVVVVGDSLSDAGTFGGSFVFELAAHQV